MENDLSKNNSNLVFSVGILIIIIIVGVLFIKSNNNPKATQVVNPDGSTVLLYDTVPPQLPSDLIVEDLPLEYSGVTTTLDGKEQVTVSYRSGRSVKEAIDTYQDTLNKNGWKAQGRAESYVYGTMIAIKNGKTALMSFSVAPDLKTLVTYQYEK